jgi:DNA-binding CsgD family transcriptional regulator
MPDISKHFFISLYIVSFFLGIVLLTLNQIYIVRTKDVLYKKLQYYNWTFWAHIMINFIYFYGLYFWSAWEIKHYILLVLNTGYVVFIFFTFYMLQGFSGINIPRWKTILISSSAFYVGIFFLFYEDAKVFAQDLIWDKTLIVFLICVCVLGFSILFCCIVLVLKWVRQKAKLRNDLLIPVFCVALMAYSVFNAYVDISFCFFKERTSVWGINVYNLSIIFYLILNIASIPLLYRREPFINAIAGNNSESALEAGSATLVSKSTISEFAQKFHLTFREAEIIELVCRGKSNPDISQILFISNNTVKHHVNSIFKKTGVKNRYELISQLKSIQH